MEGDDQQREDSRTCLEDDQKRGTRGEAFGGEDQRGVYGGEAKCRKGGGRKRCEKEEMIIKSKV